MVKKEAVKKISFFDKISKYIRKFFFSIWKFFDKDDKLTDVQQLAFDIYEISLNDDNNIRYLNAAESYKKYIISKKYILDKEISTFLILESSKITIVNHQYRYDIDMPSKTSSKMNIMFNEKVIEDREEMEKEIFGNIKTSLAIVLSDFKGQLEETKATKKRNQVTKTPK